MIDFSARIEQGRLYFETLGLMFRQASWDDAHDLHVAGGSQRASALALIHPAWLETEDFSEIRGSRSFGFEAMGESCQAPLIWGYSCPNSAIEVDHMFPYSLGGPTRADNGLLLCRDHNRLKGHDVHLIPWERYSFPWLADQLAAIGARVSER